MRVISPPPAPSNELDLCDFVVIEWDPTSHVAGYEMWLEAVLADGGEGCKQLCSLANEPLVEGMLVGKAENLLSFDQRVDVSSNESYSRLRIRKQF